MYDVMLADAEFPAQHDLPLIDMTVADVLRNAAARAADAPALTEIALSGDAKRSWTYGELLADVERLARALSTRYAPLERIVVWAPNAPEWVLLEYACALAGLTLVPANPAFQARELAYVMKQSKAAGLFFTREHRGNPMAEIAAEAAAGAPALREVCDIEDADALFACGGRPETPHAASPSDEAQLQYTSGTTGFPKGARLHHMGLVTNATHFMQRTGLSDGDVIANYMPLFHTSGCCMRVLGSAAYRGHLLLFRVFDPDAILDQIERHQIGLLSGVPTMLTAILEAQAARSRDVSSLRVAVSGGSMVTPEFVRRIRSTFGCRFQVIYGQTEASPLIAQHHLDDDPETVAETVGQPMPHEEVSIRRVADGSVAALDEVGEICVRGYCVMLGYNDDPEATAKAIDADGWLHTGDLGTMDARGYLRVTGRLKEMIIRGGENLFPAEIEKCLLEHPAVAEVAVVGLPDEKWGEIIAAVVRPAPGSKANIAELQAHCRARLAPVKTPSVWLRVDSFPRTGLGKVQKFALRDAWLAGNLEEL
ncbi:AMP-binding protein [Pararhodobacter sp. SW119]|uniref:class I adenylate-forming enzyme family protein n=1 Tax=Pararhodobacter sp. SW119 TaxID=2780075 RepID=UPI001ADFAAE3